MVVKSLVLGLFVTVLTGEPASDGPETVRMRDRVFTIWPADDLLRRGFDVPEIPRRENAAWVYIDAINAYEDVPSGVLRAFDYAIETAWPEGQTDLELFLRNPKNQSAFENVRQASRMERCQMPYFGDPTGSVISLLLPSLSGIRMLGKMTVAEGRLLESRGHPTKALDRYQEVMRMGEHIGQGITLIEGLVGVAVWSLADRATLDAVLRQPLSAAQLKSLQRQLNDRAGRLPSVMKGLRGERTFGPLLVDEACSRPLRVPAFLVVISQGEDGDLAGVSEGTSSPSDGWGKLELRLGQLLLPDRAIKKHMLDYYDLVLERANRGPHQGTAPEFDEREYIKNEIPRWDWFSRMLLPSLSRATLLGERIEADLAILRTMTALRIYMLEHSGELPESLEEIEDQLPEGAMIDPFSDVPLRYRRTLEGCVVYSVGPNLVDDDGQAGRRWDELDLVREFPAPAIEPFESTTREEE